MKKIIIIDIDGKKNQPDFSGYDFVEFKTTCFCHDAVKLSEIRTAFIHDRNIDEVMWAGENLEVFFVYSGSFEVFHNVHEMNHKYRIPKNTYFMRLLEFLDYYKNTGEIKPEIFK